MHSSPKAQLDRGNGSTQTHYQVVCVCGGYGFPLGTASAARIAIVGRALREAGIGFHLLHCGPSPVPINTQRRGVYEGVSFEYTTTLRRPENRLARLLVYIRALLVLTRRMVRLWPARHHTLIYLYVMDGPLNLFVGCLCQVLGLPLVQELCEWLPGEATCPAFTKWLHRKPIFKLAAGALVISKAIEERVRERCAEANPHLVIHRLPAIVDAQRFAVSPLVNQPDRSIPNFVYCGTWLRDVHFLIRAFAIVRRSGYLCKLRMVGGSVEQKSSLILKNAMEEGLAPDDIVLMGCVDERTLEACYKMATALLLPLPDDDRSRTRLPNKLGEYLASGRPVVTCKIGDLTDFLLDNTSAYLAEPGNERDFASKMIAVLRDPERAEQIAAAGQRACIAHLDYRAHSRPLADFIIECIDSYPDRRLTREITRQAQRAYVLLRNCVCGLLALGLIASGRVGRARKEALLGGVVTAIYFHKPNRRLFTQCIDWLTENGYTFVSESDLLEMLYRGKTPPRGAVWLSFDDGCKEILKDVLPVIRERQIPATFFIPAGIVGGDGLFPWLHRKTFAHTDDTQIPINNGVRDAITLAEMKKMASCPGVTIGSHTVSHAVTSHLTEGEARFELGESKRALESWIHTEVRSFAYPVGRYGGPERRLLAEFGYRLAATTENALITPATEPHLLPRFNVADEIWFPEAICKMVGVWRPAIDPLKRFLRRCGKITEPLPRVASGTQNVHGSRQQSV